jgi:hypothetical protein
MHGESRASFRQSRRPPQGETSEGCRAGTALRCRGQRRFGGAGHRSNPVARRKPEFEMGKPKGATGDCEVATPSRRNGLSSGESPEVAARLHSSENSRERREGRGPSDEEQSSVMGRAAAGEGNAPKGGAPVRKVGRRQQSAVGSKPGGPHGRLQGATNLRCRCAEQTVEVGRNDKDGTRSRGGSLGPRFAGSGRTR